MAFKPCDGAPWVHRARMGVVFSLLCQVASTSHADVFRFKDGRVISGTVKAEQKGEVDKVPVTLWTVELEPGTFMQILDSDLVRNGHETLSDAEKQYAQNISKLPPTAEAHFELAGWCSRYGLRDLARAHYLRVLDIDPDHEPARVASGFKKDDNGRWVKIEEVMGGQRGKVRHGRGWRFPESVAIEQAEEEAKKKIGAATKDLRRWHGSALRGMGRQYQDAINNLMQINDPLTIGTIAEYLLDTRKPGVDPSRWLKLRLIYVQALARFQSFEAARALAQASINDPERRVREASLDALRGFGREVAIPVYVGYLKNTSNELINRAAEGLGVLNAEHSILPLIEALNTEHMQTVGGGNTTYSTGGLSFGSKQKNVTVTRQNAGVRGTLNQLTGQNHGFDEGAWMTWYARTYAAPAADLRRDL